jgi:hypothetical protein
MGIRSGKDVGLVPARSADARSRSHTRACTDAGSHPAERQSYESSAGCSERNANSRPAGRSRATIERDQLQQQTKDQQEIISRQKVELDAAKKCAKGGSVWQRAKRIAKWGAIFGATGYVIGRTQR